MAYEDIKKTIINNYGGQDNIPDNVYNALLKYKTNGQDALDDNDYNTLLQAKNYKPTTTSPFPNQTKEQGDNYKIDPNANRSAFNQSETPSKFSNAVETVKGIAGDVGNYVKENPGKTLATGLAFIQPEIGIPGRIALAGLEAVGGEAIDKTHPFTNQESDYATKSVEDNSMDLLKSFLIGSAGQGIGEGVNLGAKEIAKPIGSRLAKWGSKFGTGVGSDYQASEQAIQQLQDKVITEKANLAQQLSKNNGYDLDKARRYMTSEGNGEYFNVDPRDITNKEAQMWLNNKLNTGIQDIRDIPKKYTPIETKLTDKIDPRYLVEGLTGGALVGHHFGGVPGAIIGTLGGPFAATKLADLIHLGINKVPDAVKGIGGLLQKDIPAGTIGNVLRQLSNNAFFRSKSDKNK